MSAPRSWRLVLLLLGAGLVAFAAYAAWLVAGVASELGAVADDGERLRNAVSEGDDRRASVALGDLQRHADAAADTTSGAVWGLLEHVPFFGDDAEGVAVASEVVADLSTDGLPGLVTASQDLEALLPRAGRLPLRPVHALQEPVAEGRVAFATAAERLAEPDPSGFDERLRTSYRELVAMVTDASAGLATADTALTVLPSMLGGDGPRTYLLVFQNNAEIRATGGLPGAAALLEVEDGQMQMTKQLAGADFRDAAAPVLPLTEAERALYGTRLGRSFTEANLTPDFPRAAALMRARWEQVHPERIDGVITLDTVALSYLLEATGPVEVDGIRLTRANAVDELLHRTYLRMPDPSRQDAWFAEVARDVFERLATGVGSSTTLMEALSRATEERRLLVHSFDDRERRALAGTEVAGELVTDRKAGPQVGVYLNDGTGAKMSYFLRSDVRLTTAYCQGGVQGLNGHATLTSTAPRDAADLPRYVTGGGTFGTDPGEQTVVVHLYGPVGGSVDRLALDGEPAPLVVREHGRRPVATVRLDLGPGDDIDLEWGMTTGPGQTGPVRLTVTPGVVPGSESRTVTGSCG